MMRRALLWVALGVLVGSAVGLASAHYTPATGDRFAYNEQVSVGNGQGDYLGYTESTVINGSLGVTGAQPNGTESAYYYNLDAYSNNTGTSYSYTSSGTFTFSAQTFHYVTGTDNQTGYTNPYVWFYMDNSLPVSSNFYLLNSEMTVVSTSDHYDLGTAAGDYVLAIFAEGNGTYQRNDVYGQFSASYNWKAYFDPGTGYILGYLYTEVDTNASGDGFTLTDSLSVTSTTYALTSASGPPSPASGPGTSTLLLVVVGVVVIVVVAVVVALLLRRSRRAHPLPPHSATGRITYTSPVGPPPPPISLTPGGQPAVQQIVIKETVKVNCRYCGALIDSTAEKCPYCGAART
jgi:hypothetical protein